MNVLIMTDLEGVTGMDDAAMIQTVGSESYLRACELLMGDLNAAVEGCLDAGAERIYAVDGHGSGGFVPELLHSAATPVSMREFARIISGREVGAVMSVGTHAMAGTLNGFMDHTQSSARWYNYIFNGRRMGETEQIAIFAGAFGIPVTMMAGDVAACAEAREFLGNIATVGVKRGICRNRAEVYPQDECLAAIRAAAAKGISLAAETAPFEVQLPACLELQLCRADYCDELCAAHPELRRVDARTVRKTVNEIRTYTDILF